MPKTAILISTFNRGKFLEMTVNSLLKTKGDYDIYIIDDGSTDGTQEMMEKYRGKVRYIPFGKNQGLRWVLNYGIQKLLWDGYDYISYNQDDVAFPDPGWLQDCIYAWEHSETVGFITGHEAPEHETIETLEDSLVKNSCRATHLFASTERWKKFGFPIPELTPGVAAPKLGQGSKVDWWLMGHDDYEESKHSLRKEKEKVLVLPGRAIHFAPQQSTWGMVNPEKWVLR